MAGISRTIPAPGSPGSSSPPRCKATRTPPRSTPASLLIGSDEEGGTVTRASRNPNLFEKPFSSPQKLAAQATEHGSIFSEDAWEKNSALLALGINVNLAPVADVSTDPADFIYDRALGQDAAATADYAAQVVTAMRESGIGSVLKHFPGYGSNADTHTGIALDERSLETFRQSDFLPFAAGIEAGEGTAAVLVSHNIMAAVDSDLPASLSPAVHDLLREELGFTGVAMTDDLAWTPWPPTPRTAPWPSWPWMPGTISSSPPTTAPRSPRSLRRWKTAPSPWTPSTPPAAGC